MNHPELNMTDEEFRQYLIEAERESLRSMQMLVIVLTYTCMALVAFFCGVFIRLMS